MIDYKVPHPSFGSDEWTAACSKVLVDLENLFYCEGRATINEIEMIVMKGFETQFSRRKTATILDLSVRNVRSKLNERGVEEERT